PKKLALGLRPEGGNRFPDKIMRHQNDLEIPEPAPYEGPARTGASLCRSPWLFPFLIGLAARRRLAASDQVLPPRAQTIRRSSPSMTSHGPAIVSLSTSARLGKM